MYEVIFKNDNGKVFTFGPNGSNYFGMNIGDGLEVELGKSQGFAQVGETVETQSISGRFIDVTGMFYGNIVRGKNNLRNVCAPMASGKLIFQGAHYIRVYVKAAPSFSAVRNNGLFKMQFYAPFPFFSAFQESYFPIGGIVPSFRFPVNYGKPHRFGTRSNERYVNVLNSGDVRIQFRLVLRSEGVSSNPILTNITTFAFLKINGTINIGQFITIYRDNSNVLRAELTSGNEVTDVITWIDDESSLFELEPGDNLISANDDQGGAALIASFTFNPAVGALYETESL